MGDVQIANSNSCSKISLLLCHNGEKKIIILLIKTDLFWKNITRPRHLDSGEWAVTSRFLNAKNMLEERKCVMYQEFVVCNVAGNCINERRELNNILLQVGKHMARKT